MYNNGLILCYVMAWCYLFLVETFGIADTDVYLVHDELDKVLGKWAMKEGGSAR